MIERLIAAVLKFRVAVIGATLLVVGAGGWAFTALNVDAFPELTPTQVDVLTPIAGLSPNEVENLVTYPLETSLMGLPHATGVRSISKANLSMVTVGFDDEVDIFFARAQVQQRVQEAMESLPAGAHPMLAPAATAMGEIYQYLVESDSASLIELSNVNEYTIKPLLRTIPGVADVNVWGGEVQQFHVDVDPNRLAGYGLTLDGVAKSLGENNSNFGAGYLEQRGERFTVRGLGRVANQSDLENVVLATRAAGTPVLVRDVAKVSIGPMPREGAISRDGRGEAVAGKIIIVKGTNGRAVSRLIEERMAVIRPLLPAGVRVRSYYDQGIVVDHTTRTVFTNLGEGALLVTLVLLLFLRNFRAALITASVIPLSLLAAALAMRESGVSANLMSLGALDFGLLVDASVVMVENFIRRLEQQPSPDPEVRRSIFRTAAFEVGRPIVFGVAIIIAVYVPIFSLQGMEGRMFAPMAFTVCVALIGSLVLALTYVPAIGSLLIRRVHETPPRWFVWASDRYQRVLERAIRRRLAVTIAAVVVLALTVASVPFLGSEFMPELDEGSLLIETQRLPSTSLPQGMAIAKEVEQALMKFPEVSSIVTTLGRPEMATEIMGLYQADVYVNFKAGRQPKATEIEPLIERMDDALSGIPGVTYSFSAPMAMRLEEVISGLRTDVGVKIFGDDLTVLRQKGEEIAAVVAGINGAEDVATSVSDGALQLELQIDRAALARLGMNVDDLRGAMETGVGGATATTILDGRRRYPVVVRLAPEYRDTPDAIGRLLVQTPTGARMPLSQLAKVTITEGPERINHEGGERMLAVLSNVRGRDLGGFVSEVRREVSKRVSLPEGYFLTYGGQFENQERAMRRLAIIVPGVFLIIVGFLYASFGNARQAVLVMLNVPFALIGGVGALWLRGLNLSLSAGVGFIALFGVAVLNGVVMITYINQLRASGQSLADAVRSGALVRLRPVLMTALVASVGFLPMAISTSQGAEVQRPLATVVIGGLLTSTILTLVLLPVLYGWLEERSNQWSARAAEITPGHDA